MNLGPLIIKHIPQGKELIDNKIFRCEYSLIGECQLLNKNCDGNKRKCDCEFLVQKKNFN